VEGGGRKALTEMVSGMMGRESIFWVVIIAIEAFPDHVL